MTGLDGPSRRAPRAPTGLWKCSSRCGLLRLAAGLGEGSGASSAASRPFLRSPLVVLLARRLILRKEAKEGMGAHARAPAVQLYWSSSVPESLWGRRQRRADPVASAAAWQSRAARSAAAHSVWMRRSLAAARTRVRAPLCRSRSASALALTTRGRPSCSGGYI